MGEVLVDNVNIQGVCTSTNSSDISGIFNDSGRITVKGNTQVNIRNYLSTSLVQSFGIVNYTATGQITLGEDDGNIESYPKVSVATTGVVNTGVLNFYDGEFTATTGLSGSITKIAELSELKETTSSGLQTVKLVPRTTNVVKNIDTNELYTSLLDAVEDVEEFTEETTNLQVLRDFYLFDEILVSAGKKIKLDINGKNIKAGNAIINEGELELFDSDTYKRGTIISGTNKVINNKIGAKLILGINISQASGNNVIHNIGELTINGGNITLGPNVSTSSGEAKIILNESAEDLVINDATLRLTKGIRINSVYGIHNIGAGSIILNNSKVYMGISSSSSYADEYFWYAIYNNGGRGVVLSGDSILNIGYIKSSISASDFGTYGIYNKTGNIEIKDNSQVYGMARAIYNLSSGYMKIKDNAYIATIDRGYNLGRYAEQTIYDASSSSIEITGARINSSNTNIDANAIRLGTGTQKLKIDNATISTVGNSIYLPANCSADVQISNSNCSSSACSAIKSDAAVTNLTISDSNFNGIRNDVSSRLGAIMGKTINANITGLNITSNIAFNVDKIDFISMKDSTINSDFCGFWSGTNSSASVGTIMNGTIDNVTYIGPKTRANGYTYTSYQSNFINMGGGNLTVINSDITGASAAYLIGGGNITFENTNIHSNDIGIRCYGTSSVTLNDTNLDISSTLSSGNLYGLLCDSGATNIIIKGNSSISVDSSKGGNTCVSYGIKNSVTGNITLGEKGGYLLREPTITAKNYGLHNSSGGTFTFYDGQISATTSITGGVNVVEDNTEVKKVNDGIYEVAYLDNEISYVAQIGEEKYYSINEAIEAVPNGLEQQTTIKVIASHYINDNIIVPTNKNIKIDLDGNTLNSSVVTTFMNNAMLEVVNGNIISAKNRTFQNASSAELTLDVDITQTSGTEVIYNEGLLTVQGGNIAYDGSNLNARIIYNVGSKDVTVEGGILKNTNPLNKFSAIYNEGTGNINVTDAEISLEYAAEVYGINNKNGNSITVGGNTRITQKASYYTQDPIHGSSAIYSENGDIEVGGTTSILGIANPIWNNSTGKLSIIDEVSINVPANDCISGNENFAIKNGSGDLLISGANIESYLREKIISLTDTCNVTITNSTITTAKRPYDGNVYYYDAIYGNTINLTLNNTTFSGCGNAINCTTLNLVEAMSNVTMNVELSGINCNTLNGVIENSTITTVQQPVNGRYGTDTYGSAIVIKNGTLDIINTTTSGYQGIYVNSANGANVTISNNTKINANKVGIHNTGGTFIIDNSDIIVSTELATGELIAIDNPWDAGNITVLGESIIKAESTAIGNTCNCYGIKNTGAGTITLGENDGIVLDTPTIIGKTYGIENTNMGKLYFYDGKVLGTTAIEGSVYRIAEGTSIVTSVENSMEAAKLGVGVVSNVAEIDGVPYTSIAEAVSNVVDNVPTTITVTKSHSITEELLIPQNKIVTIDLNGKKVITCLEEAIRNRGTLEIKDSSTDEYEIGTIKSSYDKIFYNEYRSTFTLTSGEIILNRASNNQNKMTNIIYSLGDVNINGGKVEIQASGYSRLIQLERNCNFTMTGGIVKNAEGFYVDSLIYSNSTGDINITGGTLFMNTRNCNGTAYIIYNNNSPIVIAGTANLEAQQYPVMDNKHLIYGIFNDGGTIEIKDSAKIKNVQFAIYNNTDNTLTISDNVQINTITDALSGSYYINYGAITQGAGKLEITGGTINGANRYGAIYFTKSANIEISNCTITGTDEGITGARIDGTISNSNVTSLVYNAGEVTVSNNTRFTKGVSISLSGSAKFVADEIQANLIALYNNSRADISNSNIYGGNFGYIGNESCGIYMENNSKINLVDTNVRGYYYGILISSSTAQVSIKGGSVTTTTTGRTVEGKSFGIYSTVSYNNQTVVTLGEKDGIVSKAPVITGYIYGIYNIGTLNFYDGKIKGRVATIMGDIADKEEGYDVTRTMEEEYMADTLEPVGTNVTVALIGSVEYTSLQAAINACANGEETVVTLKQGIMLTEKIVVPVEKNAILNLNGFTIYSNTDTIIENNGTLTITDNSAGRGGMLSNDTGSAIKNNGTVNVGKSDQYFDVNYPRVRGTTYGIENSGTVNFYSGKISGATAVSTGTSGIGVNVGYTIQSLTADSVETLSLYAH